MYITCCGFSLVLRIPLTLTIVANTHRHTSHTTPTHGTHYTDTRHTLHGIVCYFVSILALFTIIYVFLRDVATNIPYVFINLTVINEPSSHAHPYHHLPPTPHTLPLPPTHTHTQPDYLEVSEYTN